MCSCISFWRSFAVLSTLFAGPAGVVAFCADTIGADRALEMIAAASIEVFMVIFPYGV
jgi:hypothetical protein